MSTSGIVINPQTGEMTEPVIAEAEEKVWAKEELRLQFISHKVRTSQSLYEASL